MKMVSFRIVCFSLLFAACADWGGGREPEHREFSLQSSSFKANDSISYTHSCVSSSQKPPALAWNDVPSGTQSFALIMDDPDAVPVAGYVWQHWLLYDIPDSVRQIAQGTGKSGPWPKGSIPGTTSFGDTSYGGPCPPAGQLHHYHFRLYALNVKTLGIKRGATAPEIKSAMKGKIVDSTDLVGTFKR